MRMRDERGFIVGNGECISPEHWAILKQAKQYPEPAAGGLAGASSPRDPLRHDGRWSDTELREAANHEVVGLFSELVWRVARGGTQAAEVERVNGEILRRMSSSPRDAGPDADRVAKLRRDLATYKVPNGGVENVPDNCVVVLRETVEWLLEQAALRARGAASPRDCPMCGDPGGYGHACPEQSD